MNSLSIVFPPLLPLFSPAIQSSIVRMEIRRPCENRSGKIHHQSHRNNHEATCDHFNGDSRRGIGTIAATVAPIAWYSIQYHCQLVFTRPTPFHVLCMLDISSGIGLCGTNLSVEKQLFIFEEDVIVCTNTTLVFTPGTMRYFLNSLNLKWGTNTNLVV